MSTNVTLPTLPADLPEDWALNDIVSPGGTEAGLTEKHGYNYLMQQVNATQEAFNSAKETIEDLNGTVAVTVPIASTSWQSRTAKVYNPDSGSWSDATDGSVQYYVTLTPAQHGRKHKDFGFVARMSVGGKLLSNTWACIETDAEYDTSTGNITVTANDQYDCEITFYG